MISFRESMELLDTITFRPRVIKRYLMDSLGYHLAKDIIASYNSPSAPTAAMDGYAIRFEDQNEDKLKIAGINPAGASKEFILEPKSAIKTFTGSIMPKGSDTLIPIENVEVEKDYILIKERVERGFSVRQIGENFREGEILIPKGEYINYSQIGVMAALNIVNVEVFAKPRVSILSSGSELLELGEEQKKQSEIRSSNNYTIEAIVKRFGGEPVQLGVVKDDLNSIKEAILNALRVSDIVVTTGGVSVGDFDFVKDVVKEVGAEVLFKGVVIKPGQHIMVATKDEKVIVALPGFAYSSTVTALLYVVPLIKKFQGSKSPIKKVKAILQEPFIKRSKKEEFTPANLDRW